MARSFTSTTPPAWPWTYPATSTSQARARDRSGHPTMATTAPRSSMTRRERTLDRSPRRFGRYQLHGCRHRGRRLGNAYVTGWSRRAGTDYATIKYDPAGNELWVARYDGPDGSQDEAVAIAIDTSGNVYVTGRSKGEGTDYDYATVKYDHTGREIWSARFNSLDDYPDEPISLAPTPRVTSMLWEKLITGDGES